MIRIRILLGASGLALAVAACAEPERNDPAPPGMSAGSVTIGGAGSSASATTDPTSAGTSGMMTAGPTTTVSTSMPGTDSDTSATGDTLTGDTGDTGTTGIDPTANPSEPPTSGITTFATDGM